MRVKSGDARGPRTAPRPLTAQPAGRETGATWCTLPAMKRWMTVPIAALAVGCAQGAPIDEEGGGTTGMTAATAMTTSTSATTATGPDTTTGEATTGPGTTTAPVTSTTTEATTGTTGDPTVLGEYYPFDQVHSPITPDIAAAMVAIAAKGAKNDGVFAKVGGASTASANFAYCLATPDMIVGLPLELQPTVDYFNANAAGIGKTSFNRESVAAMPGWTAADVIVGAPAPVVSEVTTINARFAVVLLGTHELDQPQPDTLYTFADNLVAVVDTLIAAGTVPILSTLPDRTQPPGIEVYVPRYNAVIRAVAQGRKVPLVDLNLALAGLPTRGLAADGIDLSVALDPNMAPLPCSFDMVVDGYNERNLVTLEVLERARQVVVEGAPAPDATAPTLLGAGTLAEPIAIPGLPFVDFRSTADSASDVLDGYAGACLSMGSDGPEYVYELTVAAPTTIRAMVFDAGAVDVDLHLMTQTDSATCVKRGDRELEGPLQPGTYYLSVDTLGVATPGDFAFVVLAE